MKYIGLDQALGARGVLEYSMAFQCDWMPTETRVQLRRFSLCGVTCNVLNQLSDGVVFYYPPVFPHYRSQETGTMQYLSVIPAWWYAMAQVPSPPLLVTQSQMDCTMSAEVCVEISKYLENPSRLVMSCTSVYRTITIMQQQIVSELANQRYEIARMISWWGHRTWTQGRMPVVNPVEQRGDAEWLARLYQRWDAEEERYMAMDLQRQGVPLHIIQEMEQAEAPAYRGEDELRWYDAENFFEQAVEEAYVFGERMPIGTVTDVNGHIHLLYSDDEVIEDDESSSEY